MEAHADAGRQAIEAVDEATSPEKQVHDLFLSLQKPVFRYLCAATGNAAEAEDLTQETFIRLYQSLRKGEAIENFRAWVFRVAHNLAVNSWKRAGNDSAPGPLFPHGDSLRSSEQNAEQGILEQEENQERRVWISMALKRLSPQERQCLELRAEGLRYREIADVLGVRLPTVQTVLARAVAKMTKPGVRL